ncbi:NAD-dependent epimerase/dehydratase family protein [Microcella alkalica]|uniref:NAD-dependent epimerase/dehydratase family protein n=1 Tax=Microcella alkalica TaxID=355930 RepID=UPI00145CEAD1|nr:NAD-dependent epimerase/dehydratase family protein [Microcella alkalica]
MADVLVVGGNGFIGSHLVDALDEAGHAVTAFDRFSSGAATFRSSRAVQLPGDFLSRSDLRTAVAGRDVVFHFLATTSPATAEADPTLDIRTNVTQSVELLSACADAGVGRVVFASTGGAIYGPQQRSGFAETDPALPVSPYGIGKLAIEHYLRYFRVKHGLHSTSLRISNPYGTRQHPNRKQGLIPIALRQIARGESVTRYGDGSMVRDYIYVDDLVRMIVPLAEVDPQHEVYNLGSGRGHSVREVLETIAAVTGRDVPVREIPTPSTFVDRVVLDVSRFDAEFGIRAPTSLEQGIAATWTDMLQEQR